MKKIIAFAVLLAGVSAATAFAAPPAVFYSDLVSGPKTGGKDNKGVIVTIVGKNFGASQGTNYVSVGGGKADGYLLWSDTKVSFQLGANAATGDIKVTTGEGASNGVPFTVRAGNIYFVSASASGTGSGTYGDPWQSPASYFKAMKAGDTCYFRAGTYSGAYGEKTGSNVQFESGAPSGAANNEIAWIGYPGEKALFSGSVNFMFGYSKSYYTIAGLSMYGTSKCMNLQGDHIRVVNNRLEGLKTHAYGILHPVTGTDQQIYGNELTGATSGSKLDHPIYVGYGGKNIDIGWNWFHDNDVAEGPMISINTDYAITNHYKFENIRVHDNILDCRKSSVPLRGIGVVATDVGSSVYIYNNVFINPGPNTIYQYSASSYIYNNLFYNASGSAVITLTTVLDAGNDYRPETVEIKNNIFQSQSGTAYVSITNESMMKSVTVDNNAYYGNGSGPARDTHAVNASPALVNPAGDDYHLTANSPCVNKGLALSTVVKTDKDGTSRPQGSAFDIGPYEYFTGGSTGGGTTPPPVTTIAIGGTVRDTNGAGVSGVNVALGGGATASTVTGTDGTYRFSGLATGTGYTVTPSKSGLNFTPATRSVSAGTSDIAGQDFTGAVPAAAVYSVGGTVADGTGKAIGGVTVTLSGGGVKFTATTAADGSYGFSNVTGNIGYTITAAKSGWTFAPATLTITTLVTNTAGQNFTGTAIIPTYTIGGTVKDASGKGIGSATVQLSGGVSQTVTTAADGSYQFSGVPGSGSYTLAASKSGWNFTPATLTVSSLSGNLASQNFTGTQTVVVTNLYTIGGAVKDAAGNGIGSVTVTLAGGANVSVVTAADGSYQFLDLAGGKDYTVTAAKAGWRFSPASITVSALAANVSGKNFSGKKTYTIRGRVRDAKGFNLSNVRVSLDSDSSTLTNASGYYEFAGLVEGQSYKVQLQKTGFVFTPSTRNVSSLTGAIDSWDFQGIAVNDMVGAGEVKVIGSKANRGAVNPDRGETAMIYFKGAERGTFELRVFTLTGQQVWESSKADVIEDQFVWLPQGMASGIYVAHVKGPGVNTYKKIAVLR